MYKDAETICLEPIVCEKEDGEMCLVHAEHQAEICGWSYPYKAMLYERTLSQPTEHIPEDTSGELATLLCSCACCAFMLGIVCIAIGLMKCGRNC